LTAKRVFIHILEIITTTIAAAYDKLTLHYCIDCKPATTAIAAARYHAAAGWLCKGTFTAEPKDRFTRVQQTKKVKVAHTRLPSVGFRIPVLGSQPAGDVNHKPGGRLPLLSARPAVTPATLKRAATFFVAW